MRTQEREHTRTSMREMRDRMNDRTDSPTDAHPHLQHTHAQTHEQITQSLRHAHDAHTYTHTCTLTLSLFLTLSLLPKIRMYSAFVAQAIEHQLDSYCVAKINHCISHTPKNAHQIQTTHTRKPANESRWQRQQ